MVDVRNLKKYFPVKGGFIQHTLGYVQAVDDISFTIQRGKVLGLVGESGCGKSTAGRTILGLTPATEGQVLIDGVDVCTATGDAMHTLRKKMQIINSIKSNSLSHRQKPAFFQFNEQAVMKLTAHHIGCGNLPFINKGNRSPYHLITPLTDKKEPLSFTNIMNLVLIPVISCRFRKIAVPDNMAYADTPACPRKNKLLHSQLLPSFPC